MDKLKFLQGWKTVAFNALTFVSVLLAGGEITKFIEPSVIIELQAAINLALRFFTTTPMGKKEGE